MLLLKSAKSTTMSIGSENSRRMAVILINESKIEL